MIKAVGEADQAFARLRDNLRQLGDANETTIALESVGAWYSPPDMPIIAMQQFTLTSNQHTFFEKGQCAMTFRFLIPQVVFMMTAYSLAFSQDTGKEIAWRIVSLGNMEIPADWEDNRFSLRQDGSVAGPFTQSVEFHGFEKNGVTTNDYGTYKVTTKISDAKSDCRHQRDGNEVTVTLTYRWSYATSVAGRSMQMKATSRTVLKLPEAAVLHPPKQLTGRIEQIKTIDAPIPSGGSRNIDTNVTGVLELRLKNEQLTPEMFQASQAVKSLPIVIEQVSAGSAK